VLRLLPPQLENPDLLVGLETADDAGVYRVGPGLALVQTVDFFTPIVDDPRDFGRIAAANALSDIYAMGGRPLTALNLVGFPVTRLPLEVLAEILAGGAEKVAEAGAVIVGGHSIDDPEPKYGLAVTGLIDPERVTTNAGARPGDRLVLTKPIGTGIITTAIKRGLTTEDHVRAVTAVMAELNRGAAEAAAEAGVRAVTDVTGFGLLGHASNLARASGVHLVISRRAVPVIPFTHEYLARNTVPGGSRANLRHLVEQEYVTFSPELDEADRILLADAVTSGGLLISVAEERLETLLGALERHGAPARAVIGRVTDGPAGQVTVEP